MLFPVGPSQEGQTVDAVALEFCGEYWDILEPLMRAEATRQQGTTDAADASPQDDASSSWDALLTEDHCAHLLATSMEAQLAGRGDQGGEAAAERQT